MCKGMLHVGFQMCSICGANRVIGGLKVVCLLPIWIWLVGQVYGFSFCVSRYVWICMESPKANSPKLSKFMGFDGDRLMKKICMMYQNPYFEYMLCGH